MLAEAPALKRLFILMYRNSPWDLQLPPEALVRDLYSRFADHSSSFVDRLELLTCFRTIWKLEPIELTADEKEEMEYELSYDYVSDEDLQYLGIDIPDRLSEAEEELAADYDDDDLGFGLFDSPDDTHEAPKAKYTPPEPRYPGLPSYLRDKDGNIQVDHRLLEEPYCYTWERMVSGKCKMPMRVEWEDYWEDAMVCAVHDFVMKCE
jgi:hypothetical protein